MVTNLIEIEYEFCEVLNAFPILKKTLKEMEFNVSDLKEGESVHDYLERKCQSEEEINFLVRKMNQILNNFFKSNDDLIKSEIELETITPIVSSGNVDDESLAEEE